MHFVQVKLFVHFIAESGQCSFVWPAVMKSGPMTLQNRSANLLVFAGSTRLNSFNRKLAGAAAALARASGAEVTRIELADFDIPMYNADLEARGTPPCLKTPSTGRQVRSRAIRPGGTASSRSLARWWGC